MWRQPPPLELLDRTHGARAAGQRRAAASASSTGAPAVWQGGLAVAGVAAGEGARPEAVRCEWQQAMKGQSRSVE